MLHVPPRPTTVDRRRVLLGAAGLAALAVTAAACSDPAPPGDLDDLTTALDRARADATLASQAAATARDRAATALGEVAKERSAHADALSAEIVRLTGRAAPTTTVTVTTTPSGAPGVGGTPPAATAADVVGALRASADSASHSAAGLTGYRAGLLASIAAACTASFTVSLAGVS
jgi:hypothetical protein